jgi:cytochrome c oxidase cbb3-type subunit 3
MPWRGCRRAQGFPNLNDDDWLWGGSLDQIYFTITHGVRNGADPQARDSQMPRFLADNILTREQIGDVADYVLSLSGPPRDPAAVARGKPLFAANCAACHGENGQGNQELGAPGCPTISGSMAAIARPSSRRSPMLGAA